MATTLIPDDSGVWNDLGVTYIRVREFDLAREALHTSLQLNPGDAAIIANIGVVQQHEDYHNEQAARRAAGEFNDYDEGDDDDDNDDNDDDGEEDYDMPAFRDPSKPPAPAAKKKRKAGGDPNRAYQLAVDHGSKGENEEVS